MTMFAAFNDSTGELLTGPCVSIELAIEVGTEELLRGDAGALVVVELPYFAYGERLADAKRRGKVVHDPRRLDPAS